MVDVYLFDFSDTIIDTTIYSRLYNEIINEILSKVEITKIDLQKIITKLKDVSGKSRVDTYDLCKKLNEIDLYYNVLERVIKHTYTLKTPELPQIFKKIKDSGKKIGVVSGSQEKTIIMFLKRFRIDSYVDFIQSGKKDSLVFWIQLEKKYDLEKDKTLVIDDDSEILKIAEHAGYKVLNVKDIKLLEELSV